MTEKDEKRITGRRQGRGNTGAGWTGLWVDWVTAGAIKRQGAGRE